MIVQQSKIRIADNTGAKLAMCIRVLGNNRKSANIGDIIIVVIKEALPNSSVKKASISRAVVIRTKKALHRRNGSVLRFNENAAILINNENNPKGSRIFGPVPHEIRAKQFPKISSLVSQII